MNWARGVGCGLSVWLLATACSDDVAPTAWKRDGQPVDRAIIESYPGPKHCDTDKVTILFLTWPPGEVGGEPRTYVRDADGVLEDQTSSKFQPDAELPEQAEYSEFYSSIGQLWFAPADQDTIAYIVNEDGGRVEAWPRTRTVLGCD